VVAYPRGRSFDLVLEGESYRRRLKPSPPGKTPNQKSS
jgi:hypothetical protein